MGKSKLSSTFTLRQRAEAILDASQIKAFVPLSESDMIVLIQELELQKLELELQNDEFMEAEQKRQSSEVKYRSAIENMLDTFYEASIQGVLLDISPSIQIISKGQYTQADLIGKSLISFYSDHTDRDILLAELFKCGKVTDYEISFVNKDGSIVPIAISSSLLYENGIPVKITGIMRDITERRQAENALRESEERYRSLANSGQALIWTSDLDKKCTYFNQVWLDFTGRTFEQEYGDGWAEGVHPDDLDRCFEIYSTSFDKRESFSMDYRLRRHDGEYRWLQDNGTPQYNSEGLFVGYIGHCLDINQHKLTADTLLESEQQFKGAFQFSPIGMALISPEGRWIKVNSQLCSILGYSQDELLNKTFQEITHPDDLEADIILLRQMLSTEISSFRMQKRYFHKSGTTIWVQLSVSIVNDNAGMPLYFVAQIENISEQKAAERASALNNDALAFLAQHSGADPEMNFFEALAHYLASALEADFVCIDSLEGDGLNARTLAVWHDGRFEDNTVYALKDTPCGEVVGKVVCCFPAGVTKLFPHDTVLQDLKAESYAGVTLWSHTGLPIGLIAVIKKSFLANQRQAEDLLKLVAIRAAGELERMEAEQALTQQVLFTQNVLDTTPGFLMLKDIQGIYQMVNQSFCDFMGKAKSEIIGKTDFELYSRKDADAFMLSDVNVINTGNAEYTDWPLAGGIETRWLHMIKTAVKDAVGKNSGVLCSGTDITARKNAEVELQTSEANLVEAQRIAKTGSWEWNMLTSTVKWSKQMYNLYDLTEDTYDGNPASLLNVVHPGDVALFTSSMDRNLSDGSNSSLEYRVVHKDGSVHFLSAAGRVEFDDSGLPFRSIGTVQDVTDRRQAEETLRENEEKYRNIFVNAQEGMFQTSVDGSYISVNPAMAKMYGFDSPEELIRSRSNISKDAYFDPNERENFLRMMKEQGFVKGYEYEVKRKDGQKIWFFEDAKAIKDEQGKILFFEGFVVDITKRKQAEVELNGKTNLLTNLIINMQEGILLEDSDRKIALTNQLFCDMFGIPAPPEALVGADCSGSAEQSKGYFKNPEKFIKDIEKILAEKVTVYNDELELVDGRFFERDYIPTYLENKYSGHLWKYRNITERKVAERFRNLQLLYTKALNAIAEVIVLSENAGEILESTNRIVGETLQLDRTLIYKVSFADKKINGLCEWLRLDHPDIEATNGEYPIGMFINSFTEVYNTRKYIISHSNSVNEHFVNDGSGDVLHREMHIKSLLWYPFNFNEQGFHVFTLNQILEYRNWTNEELEFLESVVKHVSLALIKTKLLDEQKVTQTKLEQSKERFLQVVEQSQEVIWEVDAFGLYTYVSPMSLQVYGYTPEQLCGKLHFYDMHPEAQRDEFRKAAFDIFSRKENFKNLRNAIVRPDGSESLLLTNGIPVLDEAGLLLGYRGIDADITENIMAENARAKSEEVYRLITERSNDLIFVFRLKPDLGFEYVSPSAERITGYTQEDHYNDPQLGFKLVHPDDLHFLQTMQGGIVGKDVVILRWIKKDGSIIWTESQNLPIYNQKGELVAIQGKATDISERVQAEQILNARLRLTEFAHTHSRNELQQKLLDELELLTDSSIGFFHAVNADQKTLVLQSWSTHTLLQMCKAQAKDQHYAIDKAGVWVDCVHQRKAVIYNNYSSLPHRKGLPEGHAEVTRLVAVPVFRNDKIVAIVGIGNKPLDYNERDIEIVSLLSDLGWDITERKGAEEGLKKLSQAVEQSPAIVYITSLDGIMEYANAKAIEITGYSSDELVGQNPRIFSSGEKSIEEYYTLWQTIGSGKEWKGEFHNKKKNGEYYWVMASISPIIDSGGKTTHYLAVEEDITERKLAEEKIKQQNDRLNAIVSAMPDLIFVISAEGAYIEFYQSNTNARLIPVNKVLGTNLRAFFNTEQADIYLKNIRAAIQGNELISFEYQLTEENSMHYYEARLTPYGNNKVLSFVRDVTDRVLSDIEIQNLNANLELKIVERTSQLAETNVNLISEIEERKRVDIALIESEKSYRTVVENVNEIIFQTDADGLWIFLNKSWENVTGFSVEESLGKLFVNYVHPDDRARNWELFEPMMKREKEFCRHQVRYLTNDGGYRWVEVFARLALNEQNEITGTFGTLQDITERMEAEAALIKSMELLDESQKLGHVGGWEFNIDTLIQNWTEEVYRIHEVDFTDKITVGNGINFYTPASIPVIQNAVQRAIEYNEPFDLELEITTAKGNLRSVKAVGKPDLEHHRIFGFFQDITDRKLAEDALRRSESKHSSMISNISDVIGIMGADGLMKYKSPNITKDFGWQPEDLIGTNGWLTVHPDDLDRIQKEFYSVLQKDNAAKTVEYRYLCKDGSYKPIELTAINLINDKVINGVLLNYHDISARKLAEEEIIKARNEAEKANLAKSEFLSRMSHELRTPMNSILGFAQLMDMGELIPAHKKGVTHILNSGKHLLNLINEVLDISKIEAGHISLSLEPVELKGVINEMLDVVHQLAVKSKQSIALEVSASNRLFVKADRQRLKQVLLNLINNSVKYNHDGGSVDIKTELMSANSLGISMVRISVTDTGIGINPEDIQKLFMPFERIGAEKTGVEGTGLGLMVVKKLMDLMGGSIGVESVPGKGSTFWIELPMVESQLGSSDKTDSLQGVKSLLNTQKASILYIEDNTSNVELVDQILSSQRPGIQLVASMNGTHAVNLALETKPDLILLDLNLPDIHGSEVIKLLQADEGTKTIPVIIISADAMPHQLQKLMKAGAKNYLTKPLDVLGFLKIVDEWVGEKGIRSKGKRENRK